MKDLIKGVAKYPSAFRFVKKHKLWWFVAIPGIVNILLVFGMVYFSIVFSNAVMNSMLEFLNLAQYVPDWLEWGLTFVIGFAIRIFIFAIYFMIYKSLIMILLSPMLSYLAEKVRAILTGEEKPFTMEQLISDSLRGIRMAFRGIGLELLAYLVLAVFSFIPVINLLTPILLVFVQTYFHGFSMLDYCMEARGYNYHQSILEIKKRRSLAVGNGLGFYLLTLIPVLGWMFAPTLGIVSAYLCLENRDA